MFYYLFMLTSLLFVWNIKAFNVNVNTQLQLKLPSSSKSLNPDQAYFGYSLSFAKDERKTWLYVGAPKANTTGQRGVFNPGAVFKCLIFDFYGTKTSEPCLQLPIDEKNTKPNEVTEIIREDAWLGSSIYAIPDASNLLLACGNRGRIKIEGKENYYAKGICFGLHGSNEMDRYILSGNNAAYLPGTNASVFKEGYTQFGTSVGVSMAGDYIAFGTPGLWQWRGGLFVKTFDSNCTIDNLFLEEDSYLGYSVTWLTLQNLNNEVSHVLVGGAPRANIFGKVVLYQVYHNCTYNLLQNINGPQFGSYFGATLLAVPSSSDQSGDLLLVGSPFFNQSSGDEGAVFLYAFSKKMILESKGILRGNSKRGARFGIAIELLGDANLDGYLDIVVGAPYEDMGVIYIYLGTKDGLDLKYSQVINSKQLFGNQMKRVGHSMKSIISSNGYPILAIGSHKNDTVVLVGSQPVHGLEVSLKFADEKIQWSIGECLARGEQIVRMKIDLIFRYLVPQEEIKLGIPYEYLTNITYNLHIDTLLATGKRGYIESKVDKAWMERVTENISFNETNLQFPLKITWTVVFPIPRQPSSIGLPVVFVVNFTQGQRPDQQRKIISSISDFMFLPPVLDAIASNSMTSNISFHKECGTDDICQPNFKLSFNQSAIRPIIGSQSPLTIPCHVTNDGESAYGVAITITHPVILSFDSVLVAAESCNHLVCVQDMINDIKDPSANTLINCELENPIKEGAILKFNLYFTWNSYFNWTESIDPLSIKVRVKTNETSHEEPVKTATRYEAEIVEASKTLEEVSLPTSPNDILSINHRMELRNAGPGLFPRIFVDVVYLQFANQLNTTTISVTLKQRIAGRLIEHDLEIKEFVPANVSMELPIVEKYIDSRIGSDANLQLDSNNVASSFKRVALDGFLSTNAIEIVVNYNLDELLIAKLQSFETSTFISLARIYPRGLNTLHSDWSEDCCHSSMEIEAKSIVTAPKKGKSPPPTWAIIVGLILGLMLFCLAIFVLWKCGFFRRTKHEQLIAGTKRSRILSTNDANPSPPNSDVRLSGQSETGNSSESETGNSMSGNSVKKVEEEKVETDDAKTESNVDLEKPIVEEVQSESKVDLEKPEKEDVKNE